MTYLQLFREQVCDDGSKGREKWSKEDAHISYVDRDVDEPHKVVQGGRGHHQTRVDGACKKLVEVLRSILDFCKNKAIFSNDHINHYVLII